MRRVFYILIALSFLLVGCDQSSSSNKDDNGDWLVSGIFDNTIGGVTLARNSSSRSLSDFEIIYFYSSGIISDLEVNQQSASINSDGSFQLVLPEGSMFVAFLVDPTETFEKVKGVIGIGTGDNSYWESIDSSYIEGDLNLGTIKSDATAENILITENNLSSFSSQITDEEEIKILSSLDDSIRFLKNRINGKGVVDHAETWYVLGMDGTSQVTNSWVSPDDMVFKGYSLQVILSGYSGSDILELFPPEAASLGNGTTYGPDTPFVGDFYNDCFSFGAGENPEYLLQNTPTGYWIVKQNDIKIAEMDFGVVEPLNLGNFAHPIPLIRVNTKEGTDIIDTIQFKWYLLNSSGEYEECDPELLASKIFNSFDLEISDFSPESEKREYYQIDPGTQTFTPPDEWHMTDSGSADEHFAEYLGCQYLLGFIWVRVAIR